jgi:hypothetical protein
MIALAGPYAPRPIEPLGIWEHRGWRIKRYSIAYDRPHARPELVAAAEEAAAAILPQPATTATRYGVGFLGVHDGRGGNFVVVDWWEDENELHHHVLFSPRDDPEALRPETSADPIACIWDLSFVAHERVAWIRNILAADARGLDAYLAHTPLGMV